MTIADLDRMCKVHFASREVLVPPTLLDRMPVEAVLTCLGTFMLHIACSRCHE
ncbi:MAG: hypothetical protein ACKO6N_26040 [Myxococcota bacterium]